MINFIYLKPIGTWTQTIHRQGLSLKVTCTTTSDLLLSDGYKLSDFEISLGVMQGELPLKSQEEVRLPEGAIGGIWRIREQNFIHGWFYLKADDYVVVWEQVSEGGYLACQIDLTIDRVQYNDKGQEAWISNPLPIVSASIGFNRQAIQPKEPKKDNSSRWPVAFTNRWWAVMLFLMAASVWFFPKWNGVLLAPALDITTGESRIVVAILFVGSLLLWFLR